MRAALLLLLLLRLLLLLLLLLFALVPRGMKLGSKSASYS